METDPRRRVLTAATIDDMEDLWAADRGLIPAEKVRRAAVNNATVGTGRTLLSFPARRIREPGPERAASERILTSTGEGA